MNERSSRSHVIFSITVESSELGLDKQQHVRMGKLHLVDLAVSLLLICIAVVCRGKRENERTRLVKTHKCSNE